MLILHQKEDSKGHVTYSATTRRWRCFFSFPCTGGCLFNIGINAHIPSAQAKIRAHRRLFDKLWAQYVRLTRSNAYCKLPKVKRMIAAQKWQLTNLDGCQYGLMDSKGVLSLMKPWCCGSNIPHMWDCFNQLCPKDHIHGSTCGKDAVHSQYHAPYFAAMVHSVFVPVLLRR